MKKFLLQIFVLFCICGIDASEKKVFEMSWNPASYFAGLTEKVEKYWRIPENKKDVMASEFGVMLESFENDIGNLLKLLKSSGLTEIENIECLSYQNKVDGKTFFRTETEIGFAGKTQGFLQGLLKKLPEHKIPKVEKEDENLSDLHVIDDDTLLAFAVPLNFIEAFKALPQDSFIFKRLGKMTAEYLGMDCNEFIDRITGEYGGVIYVNRPKNANEELTLDFIFVVPDPEKKFYKKLGEELSLRRMAHYKNELLNVRIFNKYPDMTLVTLEDNLMIICSSPQAMVRFAETVEKKKICDNIKKLNVPHDIEYDAFAYWNREFAAVANSLVLAKVHPLRFMADFSGSNIFSAVEIDDDELNIESFSDVSAPQMLLMPYTVSLMMHADNIVYKNGREAYIADRIAKSSSDCLQKMNFYAEKFRQYAAKHNNSYPAGINGAGLKKLSDFAETEHTEFAWRRDKKIIPFGRFYYWGENCKSQSAKLPLLTDRGGIHPDKLHVLFCDGSVREFELKNVRSARRIAGFLHTVFNYDSQTFNMLIKQAENLDREKL